MPVFEIMYFVFLMLLYFLPLYICLFLGKTTFKLLQCDEEHLSKLMKVIKVLKFNSEMESVVVCGCFSLAEFGGQALSFCSIYKVTIDIYDFCVSSTFYDAVNLALAQERAACVPGQVLGLVFSFP